MRFTSSPSRSRSTGPSRPQPRPRPRPQSTGRQGKCVICSAVYALVKTTNTALPQQGDWRLDVVFDTAGGDVRARSYDVLKPGGRLVWIAPAPQDFEPTCKDVQTLRPNVALDRAHLERMLSLLDLGAVRPPAIRRYKLSEAAEAHRVIEPRHLRGKLVLLVR
jgi:NADPH:quinone reductase-like Zn-dependent oxidoreductase